MEHHLAYIMGGGNAGNTVAILAEARTMLGRLAGTIGRTSALYQTESWGFSAEQPFLNQAIELCTKLPPQGLLNVLQEIEQHSGRIRSPHNQYISRTLDLDILLYDDTICESPSLCIPHRLMQERMFVLTPLCELIPGFIHPVLKQSIEELRNNCTDRHTVEQYRPKPT